MKTYGKHKLVKKHFPWHHPYMNIFCTSLNLELFIYVIYAFALSIFVLV